MNQSLPEIMDTLLELECESRWRKIGTKLWG
jgi:hypothetical protein